MLSVLQGKTLSAVKPISNPDTHNEDPEYWEKVLSSYNLGMSRGHRPNRNSFRGGINELVVVERQELDKDSGRVIPKGHGPDK